METDYYIADSRGGGTHILDKNMDNGWGGRSLCGAFTGHDLMERAEQMTEPDCECKECRDEWVRRHGKSWSNFVI